MTIEANSDALQVLLVAVIALLSLSALYAVQPRAPFVRPRSDPTDISPSGKQVREGGDLRWASRPSPTCSTPRRPSSLYTRYVMNSICEKLYDLDAKGTIVPQLASGLPTISDGRAHRHGSRSVPACEFADGTPFDAAAVKTTLRSATSPKEVSSRERDGADHRRRRPWTPRHVVLHYKTPFAPITAVAGRPRRDDHVACGAAEAGRRLRRRTRCASGPSSSSQRVPQTSITVERDPHYYDADARAPRRDHLPDHAPTPSSAPPTCAPATSRSPTRSPRRTSTRCGGQPGRRAAAGRLPRLPGHHDQHRQHRRRRRAARRDRHAAGQGPAGAPGVRRRPSTGRPSCDSVFNNWFEPACSPISPETAVRVAGQQRVPAVRPRRGRQAAARARPARRRPLQVDDASVTNTPDTLRLAQAFQAMRGRGRVRPGRS